MKFLLQHTKTELFLRKHKKGASWGPREGSTEFAPHSAEFHTACMLTKENSRLVPIPEPGENPIAALDKLKKEYGG